MGGGAPVEDCKRRVQILCFLTLPPVKESIVFIANISICNNVAQCLILLKFKSIKSTGNHNKLQ